MSQQTLYLSKIVVRIAVIAMILWSFSPANAQSKLPAQFKLLEGFWE